MSSITLPNDDSGERNFVSHHEYKPVVTFVHNGMEVDELIWIDGDELKIIWARHPIGQTIIDGFASPCCHKNCAKPPDFPGDPIPDDALIQRARRKVQEAFEQYWSDPLTREQFVEQGFKPNESEKIEGPKEGEEASKS